MRWWGRDAEVVEGIGKMAFESIPIPQPIESLWCAVTWASCYPCMRGPELTERHTACTQLKSDSKHLDIEMAAGESIVAKLIRLFRTKSGTKLHCYIHRHSTALHHLKKLWALLAVSAGWWRGSVVEDVDRSLAGWLSLTCAWSMVDRWPLCE